jgi:hypothetical protein
MPKRRLKDELDLEEQRRMRPEFKRRRESFLRSEDSVTRECEREGVRHDAREDSRVGFSPRS